MKIAVIIVRVLLGLLYLFASIAFFAQLAPAPALQGDMKTFMEGMMASRYMFPLAKVVELVCGLALVSGLFTPLATVVIFPITLNILMIHICLDPAGIPMAIGMLLANLFLAYAYRRAYQPLFVAKYKL